MNRIDVGPGMETAVPGLYACGDGSGWSQGIIHSAATGLLVAEAIGGRTLEVDDLSRALGADV